MKNNYEEWLSRARSALALAKQNVDGVFYEDLCFQAQQCAEKALKGLIIYYGVEHEYTHNIERLLKELKKHTDIPDDIKPAVDLTDYAVTTRYPDDYNEITEEEYMDAIKIAEKCLEWVENKTRE